MDSRILRIVPTLTLAAAFLLLGIVFATPTDAAEWNCHTGCYYCGFKTHPTDPAQKCKVPENGTSGNETCYDTEDQLIEGLCYVQGEPCEGGSVSGGSPGGGGPGECTISMTGFCPTSCMSCNRVFF